MSFLGRWIACRGCDAGPGRTGNWFDDRRGEESLVADEVVEYFHLAFQQHAGAQNHPVIGIRLKMKVAIGKQSDDIDDDEAKRPGEEYLQKNLRPKRRFCSPGDWAALNVKLLAEHYSAYKLLVPWKQRYMVAVVVEYLLRTLDPLCA